MVTCDTHKTCFRVAGEVETVAIAPPSFERWRSLAHLWGRISGLSVVRDGVYVAFRSFFARGVFFAKKLFYNRWMDFWFLPVCARTQNNTRINYCSQFDVRVCVCSCPNLVHLFLQCNKPVILHSLVPHSMPASLSWLLICPFSTTLKYNLFTDNCANWRRTGERKGVQTYMY